MTHDLLIIAHAAAGVLGFVAGILSLRLSTAESWRFRLYAGCLTALVVFMAAAIAVDWAELDTTSRWVYGGLFALGLYMLWRVVQAGSRLRRQGEGWRPKYVDDVGFTLISLFDGFVIVAAIDLNLPGWLVGAIAVAGVIVGILAVNQVKARLAATPEVT